MNRLLLEVFIWLVILGPKSFHSNPLTNASILAGHALQFAPPQSISRSPLFKIPSSQLGKVEMAVSIWIQDDNDTDAKSQANSILFNSFLGIS